MRLTDLIYGVGYSLVVLINGEMIMKNANEPAMPAGEKWRETIGGNTRVMSKSSLHAGLTKREVFAMHAMQGIMFDVAFCQNHDLYDVAELAVKQADALLAELEKTSDN